MGRKLAGLIGLVLVLAWLADPVAVAAQDDVTWLLGQINGLRAGLGLHAYALNPALSAAAQQQSQYMADTCTVTHSQANGSRASDRAAANGYGGDWISENIYGGTNARAADAWNFWINSPIHYQGLTHQIDDEIGIGVAHSDCGQYYTLVFGHSGAGVPAAVPPVAPPPIDDGGPAAAPAPPPTQVPYVPPPPTSTPTATIPTLTPSATWTITPTHTPSPTGTAVPATETPLVLPTVPALDQAPPGAAGLASEATGTSLVLPIVPALDEAPPGAAVALAPSATALPPTQESPAVAAPESAPAAESGADGGFQARDLIPALLLGQAVLIGVVGFVVFRRGSTRQT